MRLLAGTGSADFVPVDCVEGLSLALRAWKLDDDALSLRTIEPSEGAGRRFWRLAVDMLSKPKPCVVFGREGFFSVIAVSYHHRLAIDYLNHARTPMTELFRILCGGTVSPPYIGGRATFICGHSSPVADR